VLEALAEQRQLAAHFRSTSRDGEQIIWLFHERPAVALISRSDSEHTTFSPDDVVLAFHQTEFLPLSRSSS
jgi:hypothetical protein